MHEPLRVLVYVRESSARYRERLVDSKAAHYRFCESEQEVSDAIGSAEIILGSIHFPAHLLPLAQQLRWIQVTAAGVDQFLSRATLPSEVLLTRADISFGQQLAEYVMGHLLSQSQQLATVRQLQLAHAWHPIAVESLKGQTMGIAGTGSIGRIVAARAQAFGIRTLGLATSSRSQSEFDAVYGTEDLHKFLPALDVLTLCLPLTDQTRDLIGARELALMKPTATLINVARGEIVNERALIHCLRAGELRSAILDVFNIEPLPPESPLWDLERVTITSHHAGLNDPDEVIDFFLQNLERFRQQHDLLGAVNRTRGY